MNNRLMGALIYGCTWLLATIPVGCGSAPSGTADATNAELVAAGQVVYQQHCAACHGVNLEGQPNWKQPLPTGGLPAPPHDDTGHTWHHADQVLFRITKYGGQNVGGAGFKSNMPAFEGTLSDANIWAVLAFIKSKWSPQARAFQERANTRGQR